MLLRKEVIQPHLPVRLPCYDFVPITDPTFDGSFLTVRPPASGVTDFRDVTGGVYKARERIHRSVADLRLLATPTSWGRVADPIRTETDFMGFAPPCGIAALCIGHCSMRAALGIRGMMI
jgi:hypothetical protein